MSKVFNGVMNILTTNTKKYVGKYATEAAQRYINRRKKCGEVWEFLENNEGRSIIIRRRNLE